MSWVERFSVDRINASPASWDYDKLDHFDGIYIRSLSAEDLTDRLMPYLAAAGVNADRDTILKVTPHIQERLTVLSDAAEWVDFFFVDTLPEYDLNRLVPKKMNIDDVPAILQKARDILSETEFTHDAIDSALREGAKSLGVKAGQMFQPIRVAVCGKMVAPPLFDTLEILGQDTVLQRVRLSAETVVCLINIFQKRNVKTQNQGRKG